MIIVVKKLYPWISLNYNIHKDSNPIYFGSNIVYSAFNITYELYFKNSSYEDSNNIMLLNEVLQLRPAFVNIYENELNIEYIF